MSDTAMVAYWTGARPGAAFGPGQQFSRSDISLCSKFSSGSGGGLDRAIDAARANEEAEDDEDYEMEADVRCPAASHLLSCVAYRPQTKASHRACRTARIR